MKRWPSIQASTEVCASCLSISSDDSLTFGSSLLFVKTFSSKTFVNFRLQNVASNMYSCNAPNNLS